VLAFITGNSSLEVLLQGLLSQIPIDLSLRFSAGIQTGLFFSQVPRSNQLKSDIIEDLSGPSHSVCGFSSFAIFVSASQECRNRTTRTADVK